MAKEGGAFPIWRCSQDHVNDMLRAQCRYCGGYRPCDLCGRQESTSLSATGARCASCRDQLSAARPPTVDGREAARSFLRETTLAIQRAEEAALHAKNRTKPPEAYLPHHYEVLDAQRASQGDSAVPGGINGLVTWCEKQEISHEVVITHATDTDGFGVTREVESVVLRAITSAGLVFVAYENGKFVRSLGSMIRGKGTLTDAKRALGREIAERKPRAPRKKTVINAPAGREDTMR